MAELVKKGVAPNFVVGIGQGKGEGKGEGEGEREGLKDRRRWERRMRRGRDTEVEETRFNLCLG
jgi:hypothetical protein